MAASISPSRDFSLVCAELAAALSSRPHGPLLRLFQLRLCAVVSPSRFLYPSLHYAIECIELLG